MNNTSSISTSCTFESTLNKLDFFLYVFISLTAIIGNTIVFVCYFRYRILRNITNVFIISLSASDILVAVVSIPYSFGVFLCGVRPAKDHRKLGDLIYLVCDMLPSILSIYSLALVAIDRAIAIKKPFLHRRYFNRKTASISVGIMWIYTASLVSLIFAIEAGDFTLFIIFMSYVLPVLIMIVAYTVMGYVARKHATALNSLDRTANRLRGESYVSSSLSNNNSPEKISLTVNGEHEYPLVSDDRRRSNSIFSGRSVLARSVRGFSASYTKARTASIGSLRCLKRELKAAVTLSLILSCFIVSWTPFMALNIENYRCPDCFISIDLVKYFKLLHYSNSAVNPILYILLNRRWRAAFRMAICCKREKSHISEATHSELFGW